MQGLPDDWVTGVDIPRSAQLKVLGNGVVPQQALLALALLDGDGATVVGSTDRLLPTPTSNDKAGRAKVSPNQPKLPATILTLLPQEIARGLLDGDGALPTAGDVPLLPTPKATNNENRQSLDRYGMNLGQALGVTPLKAGDAMGRGSSRGVNLNHLFEHDELRNFHMGRDQ